MANVSKGYAIGDTVWVDYRNSSLQWAAQSRVVKQVDVNSSTNEATVHFDSGSSVTDGTIVTVYTSQALASAGMVTNIIAQTTALTTLDTTTSVASTSGQASTTLGRVS